jgi:hypothetical protein
MFDMSTSIIVDPEREEALANRAADEAAAAATEAQAAPQPPAAPSEDDLPEKFKGKSMKDVVAMYQNAESELGRKNNEIGMIRKLADELIGVRALERQSQDNQEKLTPLTADRLLDNPEESILGVVKREALSKTEALESKVASLEERLLTEEFEKRHPGFQDTMVSPEFGGWLQTSRYRQILGARAAQGDFAAADELFGLYEESAAIRAAASSQREEGTSTPNTSARQATTVRSGGSAAGGVVPTSSGAPKFTRRELLEMRINRPDEFDSRQEEILEAYRLKQVR